MIVSENLIKNVIPKWKRTDLIGLNTIRSKWFIKMKQILSNLDFNTKGQGFIDITKDLNNWIKDQKLKKGILLIFLKHTSCSLIINENADSNVLKDLSNYMKAIVPEEKFYPFDRTINGIEYLHSEEGLDDMPAHIRTMLTSNNLSFSVNNEELEIGLWQAVYIWEHRTSNKSRSLQLHAIGDFELD